MHVSVSDHPLGPFTVVKRILPPFSIDSHIVQNEAGLFLFYSANRFVGDRIGTCIYSKYANMWRITDDFWDSWEALLDRFVRCEKWQDHVRPGCWPDCDMLPLGQIGKYFGRQRATGFARDEQRTMLTLWCIFGSPLMLGAELTLLDDWTLSLLQNQALLHLENGSFVSRQVLRDGEKCCWAAVDPESGECYVAVFNLGDQVGNILAPLSQCAATFPENWFRTETGEWNEVWSGERETFTDTVGGAIAPHGVLLFHKIEGGPL